MKKFIVLFAILINFINSANAQWEKTNGPYVALGIRCIALSGSNIFAGTESGVYLSTDNGSSWIAANMGIKTSIISLAVSGNNIFAGTLYLGIYLSKDNGNSWMPVNNGLPHPVKDPAIKNINSIVVKGTILFAGTTDAGVFISTNNGSTWSESGMQTSSINSLAVSGNNIYAATSFGVYLSSDDGLTWTARNNGLIGKYVNSFAVNETTVYAATNYGLFKSTDNALNWTSESGKLSGYNITSVAFSDTNIFVATSNGGTFLSANNGGSWVTINNGLNGLNINTLAINGNIVLAGTKGGMYQTSNKWSNWTEINKGMVKNISVGALALEGKNILAGTGNFYYQGSVYLSFNNGTNWINLNIGLFSSSVNALVVSGDSVFAGTSYGLFLSTNNGSSWNPVNLSMINASIYTMVKSGTKFFIGTDGGVFFSSDNGKTWVLANNGLTDFTNYPNVSDLLISGTNIFAAVNSGGNELGVFRSSDNGSHWIEVNNGLPLTVSALAKSGDKIFAGTSEGMYMSSNNGVSWVEANNGLPDLLGEVISSIVVTDGPIFITYQAQYLGGPSFGVYVSKDNGTNWSAVNNGLSSLDIGSLIVSDNYIYAGTGDAGVWKLPIASVGIQETKYSKVNTSIYPNPANDNITVEFMEAQSIQNNIISISNLQGQLVYQQQVQAKRIVIDITGFARGVYTLRVNNDGKAEVTRIVKM